MKFLYIYTTLIKKFQEFIQKIKNQIYSSKSILSPSKYSCNALMPALDPILETFFIFCFRFVHQNRLRFFHYLLAAKTRLPERFFESTEQEEVAGSQISRIWWLLDGIRSVLGQKVADNDGIVRPRVRGFPQIRSFFWRIASRKPKSLNKMS